MVEVIIICPNRKKILKIRKKYKNYSILYLFEFAYEINNCVYDLLENESAKLIEEYIPTGFELLIKQYSYEYVDNLLNTNNLGLGGDCIYQEILPSAKFHFINKVLRLPLRIFFTFIIIRDSFPNCKHVYAYKYIEISRSVWGGQCVISVFKEYPFKPELIWTSLILPIFAIVYKLIYLPIYSKFFWKSKNYEINRENLFFGYLNEFHKFWSKPLPEFSNFDISLIILPSRRLKKFESFRKTIPSIVVFDNADSLLSFTDLIKIFIQYIKNLFLLRKNLKVIKNNYGFIINGIDIYEFIEVELTKFFSYFLLVAIKYYFIANSINIKLNVKRIFFSHAHSWYMSVVVSVFKKKGIDTFGYNHGLIQEALLMTSSVNINYTNSKYESSVMRMFSNDEQCRVKIHNVARCSIKIPQKVNNVLLLSKLFYVDAPYGHTIDFFNETIRAIIDSKYISNVVNIKFHPKEPVDNALKFLTNICNNYNIKLNIVSGDLLSLLDKYDFVASPMSTTILECFQKGIPFFIYKSNIYSYDTFYKEIPDEILYSNGLQLTSAIEKFIDNNNKFDSIYQNLFNKYFFN